MPADVLFTSGGADRQPGLAGTYYAGHFDGSPVMRRVDASLDFDWADKAPVPALDDDSFSVRWTGVIVPPATGRYTLGVRCATQCRLFVDEKQVAQGRSDHEPLTISAGVTLRAGRAYPVRVELEHEKYDAVAQLLWETPAAAATRPSRRWRRRRRPTRS